MYIGSKLALSNRGYSFWFGLIAILYNYRGLEEEH